MKSSLWSLGLARADSEAPPRAALSADAADPPKPTACSAEARPDVPPPADEPDAASPEEAFQRWHPLAWRVLRRLGVPLAVLEDATQELFTEVCRTWSRFEGRSSRRTWVLGFARHVATKYRRSPQWRAFARQRPAPEEPSADCLPELTAAITRRAEPEHDPFEAAARREAGAVVEAFLDSLSEKERALFVMVELEGVRVVDAAAMSSTPQRQAYKALDRLRRDFEAIVRRHQARDRWRLS